MSIRTLRPLAVALTAALLVTSSGCSDPDPKKPASDSPADVLTAAKKTLDETSGVELTIASSGLPDSGTLLVGGTGTAMHPASFEGTIDLKAMGFSDSAEVIAIDGKVWAKSSFLGPTYTEIDPARFGVPDPGELLATDGGLSDLLVETTGVKKGESVRGGEDNKEILTEYTGTLTGEQVQLLVPSATGNDFAVVYEVTDGGQLTSVELTGAFYPNEKDVTYTIDFVKYDVEKKITAP